MAKMNGKIAVDLAPGEFAVERHEDGSLSASDGSWALSVQGDESHEASYFHRVTMRKGSKGRVFVAQLGDVRLYIQDDQLIMTRQDLNF